ncbi:LysE family translocator [Ahrensia sp. 13_GOM-1096m]|uniref:LysE family translocator n=1 Tax=Ahrensia sp. 13_GOM-1096m TaxID=1380380 RepID=UPI00047DEA85|nr:LysE family translocator [Ahrensia sp. 13_GOM-1096m]
MIDAAVLWTFVLACAAIVLVPGPTVTVIIANSLRSGSKAGFMNIAGTQFGLAIMIGVLAFGLQAVVSVMGEIFDYVKLFGAAYLIYLGIMMWRSNGALANPDEMRTKKRSMNGYFWQGFFVIWSNPKALFFFGAFIPQFIVAEGNASVQTIILGGIFMIIGAVGDGIYALAAGRTGSWLTQSNIRLIERISGTALIGAGIWLALTKRA